MVTSIFIRVVRMGIITKMETVYEKEGKEKDSEKENRY